MDEISSNMLFLLRHYTQVLSGIFDTRYPLFIVQCTVCTCIVWVFSVANCMYLFMIGHTYVLYIQWCFRFQ